jgi:hypothetical protein
MQEVAGTLPFPLLGVDSDNGSEFINNNLFAWCEATGVTFTRSWPWRKNDNCFVESSAGVPGYLRYDTPEELGVLAELYGYLVPYVNFFQPQMKLIEKTRREPRSDAATTAPARPTVGSSPRRRSPGRPRPPSPGPTRAINPAQLKREIARCQAELLRLATRRKPPLAATVRPDHPGYGNHQPEDVSRASSVRQRTLPSRAS